MRPVQGVRQKEHGKVVSGTRRKRGRGEIIEKLSSKWNIFVQRFSSFLLLFFGTKKARYRTSYPLRARRFARKIIYNLELATKFQYSMIIRNKKIRMPKIKHEKLYFLQKTLRVFLSNIRLWIPSWLFKFLCLLCHSITICRLTESFSIFFHGFNFCEIKAVHLTYCLLYQSFFEFVFVIWI